MIKQCRKCDKELPLEEFYVHSEMLDGHLNICKTCVKERINNHRQVNIERLRAYDRKRGKRKERIKKNVERTRRRRQEVPGYGSAHLKLDRAVRNNTIKKPRNCEACQSEKKLEAHHDDYFKPLDVVWLCTVCHRQLHLGKSEMAESVRIRVDEILHKAAHKYSPSRIRQKLRESCIEKGLTP